MPRCVLFDFFGTLVDYDPARTAQDHRGSHGILRRLGADLPYADFLSAWSQAVEAFDRRGDADDSEFTVTEVAETFLAGALGRRPAAAEAEEFAAAYVAEWSTGVRYLPGLPGLLRDLAAGHRLAVVTNTHWPALVPGHLAAMGLADRFAAVVTSVDVGWRKPHPRIFAAALAALGIEPAEAVFVGDTYVPDFVGPERAGIPAYLIDPAGVAPVPADRRLASLFDLPSRLGLTRPG
jgi:putative hydrolase of the HAD superfamily